MFNDIQRFKSVERDCNDIINQALAKQKLLRAQVPEEVEKELLPLRKEADEKLKSLQAKVNVDYECTEQDAEVNSDVDALVIESRALFPSLADNLLRNTYGVSRVETHIRLLFSPYYIFRYFYLDGVVSVDLSLTHQVKQQFRSLHGVDFEPSTEFGAVVNVLMKDIAPHKRLMNYESRKSISEKMSGLDDRIYARSLSVGITPMPIVDDLPKNESVCVIPECEDCAHSLAKSGSVEDSIKTGSAGMFSRMKQKPKRKTCGGLAKLCAGRNRTTRKSPS